MLGVWEQQKAKELFIDYSDKGHPELPVLSATQDQGMIIREETDRFIQHDKHNEVTYKKVCPGQFVIHLRSFQGGFAHSALTGITSPAYTVFGFQHREEHDDYFWKYIFSSESFIHRLVAITYGIRDGRSISYSDFLTLDFRYPSAQEQKQIGSFFHKLDGLINLHQRQTQKLTELKQGLLHEMFPREGESVPRLRFPGFTTTWKQHKVEELMDVTSVKRIHQSDWTTSGVPFLRARDIVARSKHEKITDPLFISQEKYDEYSAISGKVKLGDLLVTGVGTIGIPLLITDDKPIYFKDGNIIWFKNINNTVDGYFLYYAFCQKKVQLFINQAAGKGTVATYTISTAKSTPLVLPSSRNEQRKIGSFFRTLDDCIHLHEQYTVKLTHLKKGLLQKMFPQD